MSDKKDSNPLNTLIDVYNANENRKSAKIQRELSQKTEENIRLNRERNRLDKEKFRAINKRHEQEKEHDEKILALSIAAHKSQEKALARQTAIIEEQRRHQLEQTAKKETKEQKKLARRQRIFELSQRVEQVIAFNNNIEKYYISLFELESLEHCGFTSIDIETQRDKKVFADCKDSLKRYDAEAISRFTEEELIDQRRINDLIELDALLGETEGPFKPPPKEDYPIFVELLNIPDEIKQHKKTLLDDEKILRDCKYSYAGDLNNLYSPAIPDAFHSSEDAKLDELIAQTLPSPALVKNSFKLAAISFGIFIVFAILSANLVGLISIVIFPFGFFFFLLPYLLFLAYKSFKRSRKIEKIRKHEWVEFRKDNLDQRIKAYEVKIERLKGLLEHLNLEEERLKTELNDAMAAEDKAKDKVLSALEAKISSFALVGKKEIKVAFDGMWRSDLLELIKEERAALINKYPALAETSLLDGILHLNTKIQGSVSGYAST